MSVSPSPDLSSAASSQFRNRVLLVTGAAGGIGGALCARMGRAGARIGMVDRDADALARLKGQLEASGIVCATAVGDVRKRDEVHAAVEAIEAALGPVDMLVPAAGICAITCFDDLRVQKLEEIMQVNFFGVVFAIEAVLPGMIRRGRGHIVGISSLAAICPLPFEGAYSASKAALAAYLKSLGPPLRRRGVQVTSIFPGFVQTALLRDFVAETSKSHMPPDTLDADEAAGRIIAAISRKRRAVRFPLLSTFAAYVPFVLPGAAYDWVMMRISMRRGVPY